MSRAFRETMYLICDLFSFLPHCKEYADSKPKKKDKSSPSSTIRALTLHVCSPKVSYKTLSKAAANTSGPARPRQVSRNAPIETYGNDDARHSLPNHRKRWPRVPFAITRPATYRRTPTMAFGTPKWRRHDLGRTSHHWSEACAPNDRRHDSQGGRAPSSPFGCCGETHERNRNRGTDARITCTHNYTGASIERERTRRHRGGRLPRET